MTCYSAIIIEDVDLKLCRMIRDGCLHDCSISMFLNFRNVIKNQKIELAQRLDYQTYIFETLKVMENGRHFNQKIFFYFRSRDTGILPDI